MFLLSRCPVDLLLPLASIHHILQAVIAIMVEHPSASTQSSSRPLAFVPETKSAIIQQIQQLVPPDAAVPQDLAIVATLKSLTAKLIRAYQADGGLHEDPFEEVRSRTIHLYEPEVRSYLNGKVVLVTGGEGCVGGALVRKLLELGARRVVSVDKARCRPGATVQAIELAGDQVTIARYAVDLRYLEDLRAVFETEQPHLVFHLAAQRLPGLAEVQIRETITSNVLGTQNLIQLCESYGVEQCIFSSTGKASRYFTAEVYAASKKMAEWQFARAAQRGKVMYGMVRFTHMLENSSFCQQFDDKLAQNQPVNVHAPDRYVVGQNVTEAVHLLLNAVVFADSQRLKFLLCRNLGWPTETLEVALYKILESGKDTFLYFQGILPGYEEPLFRGQIDWSNPSEINTLINVMETATQTIDPSGDLIVAELAPVSLTLLAKHLTLLQALANNAAVPEVYLKEALATAIEEIARSSFAQIAPEEMLRILRWGIDARHLRAEKTALVAHQQVVELMVETLAEALRELVQRSNCGSSHSSNETHRLATIAHSLQALQSEIAQLQVNLDQDGAVVLCRLAATIALLKDAIEQMLGSLPDVANALAIERLVV